MGRGRGRGRGRAPCCDKTKVRTGPWTPDEDSRLVNFVQNHGHTNWRALPKQAGLLRCGKSCRLRWINYLRPDVKRGNFTPQEEESIIQLHHSFGNQWSKIASCLPGRTDNEIKNVWNTHLKKRLLIPTSKINSSAATLDDQMKQNDFLQDSPSSSTSSVTKSSHEVTTNLQELLQEEGEMDFPWELDDVDLWEIWESLDSLLDSNKIAHHNDNDNNNINNIHVEEEEKSDEFVKWLRCLENELGLTTSDVAPPNFDYHASAGSY